MSYGQPQYPPPGYPPPPGYGPPGYGAPPPGYGAPVQYGAPQYGPPGPVYGQPPPQQGGCGCMSITIGGLVVLLLLCGGVVGIFFLGYRVNTQAIQPVVQQDPVIQQHIGDIREFTPNYQEFFSAQDPPEADQTAYTYDVWGTKGNGKLVVYVYNDDGDVIVEGGYLETPDGVRHELSPE